MRQARSYSIVDHHLRHGGYLGKLSHLALALYLFLVVVGDRGGRSFYSDTSIGRILRISNPVLAEARGELVSSGLVRYQWPYWWVRSLTRASGAVPPHSNKFVGRPSSGLQPVCRAVPEALRELIRSLEERS